MSEKRGVTYSNLRSANIARDKEWAGEVDLSLSFRGNELAGEVGEACNVIKKLDREILGLKGSRDTIAHLAEELADVIICADLIAMNAGIDLDAAVAEKFNATSEKVGLKTRLVTPTFPGVDPGEWRTCGACSEPFQGDFGACPKCAKAHKSAAKYPGAGNQRRHGAPTLDIQEGTPEWET